MKFKELRQKTVRELRSSLEETKRRLGELQFAAEIKKLKNVKEIRELKKDLARMMTLLHNNEGIKKK